MLYNKTGARDFARVTLQTPPRLLVVNSKQAHNTASIVQEVAKQKHKLQETFTRIGEISVSGEQHLLEGRDIGHLITENHNLLNKLPGVSNYHTDRIVEICNGYGVPSKITGAGGGGVVIGLVRDAVNVDGLKRTLEKDGYQVLSEVEIGVEGVHTVEDC